MTQICCVLMKMASLHSDKSKDISGEGQEKVTSDCEPQAVTKDSKDAAPSSGEEPEKPSAEQLETCVSVCVALRLTRLTSFMYTFMFVLQPSR